MCFFQLPNLKHQDGRLSTRCQTTEHENREKWNDRNWIYLGVGKSGKDFTFFYVLYEVKKSKD